jgi:acyl-CoA synthetase (AMP-forming)/AMP-acid ligase II
MYGREYYFGDLLARSARKFPNKTAVVFEGVRLTYKEVDDRANAIANSLIGMGVKRGDRVALLADNTYEWIEMYFAPAKAGAIFVPVNTTAVPREMEYVLNYVSPKVLILQPRFVDMIQSMKDRLPSVESYVVMSADVPGMENYERLIRENSKEEPVVEIDPSDIGLIIFTGGTTGMPRGAMHTHRGMIFNVHSMAIGLKQDYNDVEMHVTPIYHTAMASQIMCSTFLGNKHVIVPKFDAVKVLELIAKERVTCGFVVPTIVNMFLQVPDLEKYDLSSLRILYYGGAPMPIKLLEQALKRIPSGFLQIYGQTEGFLMAVLPPEDHVVAGSPEKVKRSRAAGRALVNYEIKILDDEDRDVPVGEVGEIVVKGPTVTAGYWDRPDETAEVMGGGWLHTGDLARMDEDGYLYIVERKKDMIISGGKNIYCPEIEEVLYRHPAVLEATVFGIPDDYWGEAVKAAVALKPGMALTERELMEYCTQNLASYKKPKSVDFLEELPKSPAGKILKRALRDKYWANAEKTI